MKRFIIVLFLISSYPLFAFEGIIIADKGLNLRNTPSSNGKILTLIPKGTTVKIINPRQKLDTISGQSGYWALIQYNQLPGFVFDRYITLNLPSNDNHNAPYCAYKFQTYKLYARIGPDFKYDGAGWAKNNKCIKEHRQEYKTAHSSYTIKWCEVALERNDSSKTGWFAKEYIFSRDYGTELRNLFYSILKVKNLDNCLEFRSKKQRYSGDGSPVAFLRTDARLHFDFINKNMTIGYGYQTRIGKIVDIKFEENRFYITFLDPSRDQPSVMSIVTDNEHLEIDFDSQIRSYTEIKGAYVPGIPISEL